uniref:Uncharacterized protein n=1 Tax=Strigamia maritima TaxID=126957 RepID=T1J6I9_STRMM
MSEGNEDELHQTGRSPVRAGTANDKKAANTPFVVQKVSPVRPSYSYPGSVAKPDVYSKFRFITEEMMEQVICEAQENLAKKTKSTGSKSKKCSATGGAGGFLENEVSKAQYDKWIKQIKWFWLEIEDYLREIETVYNEVRLHADAFENKRKDKEEEVRRNKRISEFNARSCRIVYDLQQQTKDVFSYLESNRYVLNRSTMKKLHGIHRGVVMALHNLLTRLPDYELDRGLPPVYHQLAMLIRRLAQCCFKLGIGHDVHIIRNLEGIRQKVEDANQEAQQEMPLYKLTPGVKKQQVCSPWDAKGNKTCPVVWQEEKIPQKVSPKLLEMIDVSKRGGFIAPGIDKFLRLKSPLIKEGKAPAAIGGKLSKAMGKPSNMTDEEFESMATRFKKLQQEFISEVEGQISARLKPLLQEAKKVAESAKSKKTLTIGHVQVETPKDGLAKQKIDQLLSQYTGATKLEKEYIPPAVKESPRPGEEGWGDYLPEQLLENELQMLKTKKKNRSRSPVTMRQRSESKTHLTQFKSASNVSPNADKTKLKGSPSAGFKTVRRSQPALRRASISGPSKLAAGDNPLDGGRKSTRIGLKSTKATTKIHGKQASKDPAVFSMFDAEQASSSKSKSTDDEIKWAMKGDISMWSSNQVDDMLNRLNQMENEERSIRSRWQDLLYVDPSSRSDGYRISYGEKSSFSDSKEPDAILLMKPSVKKDTVVVVGAMAEDNKTESQITISRARAGVDVATTAPRSFGLESFKESIKSYRDKFDDYLRRTSHYAVGNFDPWKVVVDVADDILNDLFLEVSSEIADIPDTCVKEIYDAEFARS